MHLARNLFSSLITFFLVPALFIYIFLSSTTAVTFNTNRLNSTLKKSNVYSKVADTVIPLLVSHNSTLENPEAQKIVENTFKKVTTAEKSQLQGDLETIFVAVHHYLVSDEQSFSTRIDLTPYQKTLSDNLVAATAEEYSKLPVCTPQDLKQMGSSEIPSCQTPGTNAESLIKETSLGDSVVKLLPNTLIITEKGISTEPQVDINISNNQNVNSSLNATNPTSNDSPLLKTKNSIHSILQFQTLLLAIILVLIILLVVSRLKHYADAAGWLASVLFSASLVPLILSFAIPYFLKPDFFQKTLQQIIGNSLGNSPEIFSFIGNTLFTFVKQILDQVKVEALVIFVVAALLFGLAKAPRLLTNKNKISLDETIKKVP